MLAIDISITVTGHIAQTIETENKSAVLDFYVEERIRKREPADFWVEVKHKTNNTYLANKTNSINQKLHSTTALLVGIIYYYPPPSDSNERKHVLLLEDISLLFTHINNNKT
ncbi:7931_t:CDS:1, partial [Dentiscutata erythropus]